MKYNILKDVHTPMLTGKSTSFFNIDCFDIEEIIIHPEQWYEMFDSLRTVPAMNLALIHHYIIGFITQNAVKPNVKVSTEQIMAFLYILLMSRTFRFNEFVREAAVAFNFYTMCYFINETTDIEVPASFLETTAQLIGNKNLYEIVTDRYDFKVDTTNSAEVALVFYKHITENIVPFMQNNAEMDKILRNLNIN